MTPETLQMIATIVGPFGAAWIGVKTAVNGMRDDVREIKDDVKDMRKDVTDHGERIAVLEASEAA